MYCLGAVWEYIVHIQINTHYYVLAIRNRLIVSSSSLLLILGFKFNIYIASEIFLLTVLLSKFKNSNSKLGSFPV